MISRRNALLLTLFGFFLGGGLGYLSPTFKNPNLDIEFWAYVVSTLIGLFALTFTIWQVRSTIMHNKLINTPHLQLNHDVSCEDLSIDVYIENTGLGPAAISGFQLYLDDKEIEIKGVQKVLTLIEVLFKDYECRQHYAHFDPGSLIPSRSRQDIFKIDFKNIDIEDELMSIWDGIRGRIKIVINYPSIYGELKTLDEII